MTHIFYLSGRPRTRRTSQQNRTTTRRSSDNNSEISRNRDVSLSRGSSQGQSGTRRSGRSKAKLRPTRPIGAVQQEEGDERIGVSAAIENAQDALRRQLRKDVEYERRRRKCRVTEEQAKRSIENFFHRLPYQQIDISTKTTGQQTTGQQTTGVHMPGQAVQCVSEEADQLIPSCSTQRLSHLSQTITEQKRAADAPVPLRVKRKLPVAVPHVGTSGPLSFGEFVSQPPKYSTDFILKSTKEDSEG